MNKETLIDHKPYTFVYLRRSQNRDDRQVLSLASQKTITDKLVKEHDLCAKFLPPESRSAHETGRPIFDDMMSRIEAGEARYIVTWKANRLARNAIDAGRLINALDKGWLISVITESRVYRNTARDRSDLFKELVESKYYSDDLSESVKQGYSTKYELGEYPHEAFVGYRNVVLKRQIAGEKSRRNIAPDPDMAPIVVEAFELASTGNFTLDDIYKHCTKHGLKTQRGTLVKKSTVQDMLQRPAYYGTFKFGGTLHRGSYQPIITKELFDEVQVLMGWAKGGRKRRDHATFGREYPFKGVLCCAECNSKLTAYTKNKTLASGKTAFYEYYACPHKLDKTGVDSERCDNPQISAKGATESITEALRKYEISKEDGVACKHFVDELFDDYIAHLNRYKDAWKKDHDEAHKALDRLGDAVSQGMPYELYERSAEQHKHIIDETERLLSGSEQDAVRWLELSHEVFDRATDAGSAFELADDAKRRKTLQLIGSNWKLRQKRIEPTVVAPFNLLERGSQNLLWRA